MTTKLQVSGSSLIGSVLDAYIYLNGNPWNGSAFVTLDLGDWEDYANEAADEANTGEFLVSFPAAISVGTYHVTWRQRSDPSMPQFSDEIVSQGPFNWYGTSPTPPTPPDPGPTPTIAEFKENFDRDFSYGTGKETVRDSDITKAIRQANTLFNRDLWDNDAESNLAYLYAAAHFLVIDLQMAGGLGGFPNGAENRGGGVLISKSVGQVSVQYGIPQSVLESPTLFQFMRTDYGLKYLAMVSPRLVGHVAVAPGYNDTGGPDGGI